ncbi:MAG: 4a-hydroxytetrahydrobiopterin dehydratase [Saccharospirillaceae bacterium]|nr:4a-hydroxytetrahydrobiopterin dehydratase [Pseudomonadales bacterium]NRB77496.1 4a-hydroxytetrahydrobiopterin dehydratase [Saccharospirillaceae bacterium]
MLQQMNCLPVQTDYERIDEAKFESYASEVPTWESIVIGNVPHLQKTFEFAHEHEVMMFTREVMELANLENHHPEILYQADSVKIMWWTQDIADLHINDFIMAAKTDAICEKILKYSYLQ